MAETEGFGFAVWSAIGPDAGSAAQDGAGLYGSARTAGLETRRLVVLPVRIRWDNSAEFAIVKFPARTLESDTFDQ